MLYRFLPIFMLASSLFHCGPAATKEDRLQPDRFRDDQFADTYFLQDVACQESSDSSEVGPAPVYIWQDNQSVAEEMPFDGVTNSASIASRFVQNTWFGYHQQKDCQFADGKESCKSRVKVLAQRRPLRVCGSEDGYSRTSVESVALSGISSLDRAASFYESLDGAKKMKRGNLLVLPKVEKKILIEKTGESRNEFMTDNLTYSSAYEGEPLFVIYPKSRRAVQLGLWKNLNLWEIPWALAHEFGHHVLWTQTESSLGNHRHSVAHQDHFHQDHFHQDENHLLASEGFSLNRGTAPIWGAVGEGYADLFAHYTLGGRGGYLKGIECFEKDRDVGSDEFIDGTFKSLTTAIDQTFSQRKQRSTNACKRPNFGEIHAVGAVLARGIDQIFEASLRSDSVNAKGALLVQWAERLMARSKNTLDWPQVVGDALEVLAEVNPRVCATVQLYFPHHSSRILENQNCR